jgi:hypothetical protein
MGIEVRAFAVESVAEKNLCSEASFGNTGLLQQFPSLRDRTANG